MKPLFHKVPTQIQASFSARHDVQPNFGSLWHYHPELELHHVIRGKGVRLIGDNIGNFSAGEVILLGGNLPHMWQCNEEYYQNHATRKAEAIVIQFLPDCMGKEFINLPEMYLLPQSFETARKGMKCTGRRRARIVEHMYQATRATEMERLIVLLSILKTMAETDESRSIASAHAFYKSNEMDAVRINK